MDYATSILFVFCNPVISSMRGLCAASRLKKVKSCATKRHLSLGSFSEAQHIFDAGALQELVCKLAAKIAQDKLKNKDILPAIKDLVAVNDSLFQTLSRVFWADWQDDKHKVTKLHLGFSVMKETAVNAVITAGNSCERKALLQMIEKGVMYVCDRYYGLDYAFFEVMNELGALFTIRIRNKPKYTVLEDYELTKEDLKEGGISGQLVRLGAPDRTSLQFEWSRQMPLVVIKSYSSALSRQKKLVPPWSVLYIASVG
ncbi:MAG: transposase [Lentisphaeraceae bacterium]|nr:transposase [Lentisphaeraceae bacterium]